MANLNTALTPAPVITVVNKDGSTASGYTGNVTMALATNPSNATLGGTATVAATAGVATFSNLTLNRSGKDFTLRATAAAQGGYTPKARVSRPFTIATRCVFTTQPVGVAAADDILPTFTVTIQDSAGNTDTAYNGEITVALYRGAGLAFWADLRRALQRLALRIFRDCQSTITARIRCGLRLGSLRNGYRIHPGTCYQQYICCWG